MAAPNLATWHPRERLWSASVELHDGPAVAWGLGSGPTREEAVERASSHACALLEHGDVHPRGAFLSWLVRAEARALLSRSLAALLAEQATDLPSTLVILDFLCSHDVAAAAALRIEALQLRARLRAEQRARTPNAPEARTP